MHSCTRLWLSIITTLYPCYIKKTVNQESTYRNKIINQLLFEYGSLCPVKVYTFGATLE